MNTITGRVRLPEGRNKIQNIIPRIAANVILWVTGLVERFIASLIFNDLAEMKWSMSIKKAKRKAKI